MKRSADDPLNHFDIPNNTPCIRAVNHRPRNPPLGCKWELRKKVLRTKHHTNRFAVFFASLLLCVSHPHPSHGHRGPCYGDMPRKGLAPFPSKVTICCSKTTSPRTNPYLDLTVLGLRRAAFNNCTNCTQYRYETRSLSLRLLTLKKATITLCLA